MLRHEDTADETLGSLTLLYLWADNLVPVVIRTSSGSLHAAGQEGHEERLKVGLWLRHTIVIDDVVVAGIEEVGVLVKY